MTRSEISYHICKISTRVKNVTTADVHTIKKVIKCIKGTPSHIMVPVLDLDSSGIQWYSDANYNNLLDGRKQGGHVINIKTQFPLHGVPQD